MKNIERELKKILSFRRLPDTDNESIPNHDALIELIEGMSTLIDLKMYDDIKFFQEELDNLEEAGHLSKAEVASIKKLY